MQSTIQKCGETTYIETLYIAGREIKRERHFDRIRKKGNPGDSFDSLLASIRGVSEKYRDQQRIVRQQSDLIDMYRDKLVSYKQNLDNCTENERITNLMPFTEGAEDMNRRQKLIINGQEKWIRFGSMQELVDLVQAECSNNSKTNESPTLVADYLQNWFEIYKRPKLDPNTAYGQLSKIKKHILPVIGKKQINDVTVADVQTIMSSLKSASTAKQVKSIINLCFEAAIADELYTHPNPAADKRIAMPTTVTKRNGLDKEDLAVVLESLPKLKPEHAQLLAVLTMTGCRRSEALALRWEDIDWDRKTIHLQRALRFRNNQPEVSDKMKIKSANRSISAWDALIPYLSKPQPEGFIFHRDGKPLTERQYSILWNNIQDELIKHGLKERFTAHQLRHTFATVAANSGSIPIKVLQGLLGHANFQTTMNTYAGLDTEQMLESSRDLGTKYAQFTAKSCSENCISQSA